MSQPVNLLTVFIVILADSYEHAACLLADHPHMVHFVRAGVEVMPALGGREFAHTRDTWLQPRCRWGSVPDTLTDRSWTSIHAHEPR